MSRALEFLRAAQSDDGGWGYKPGGMTYVEPTAAAILALTTDVPSAPQVQRARAWLRNLQRPDGGWGIAALDDASGWMTAWAVWALAGVEPEAAQRGTGWLLQTSGLRVTDPTQIEGIRRILKIDPGITGWPWQPGDAGWIFPTALALLALHAGSPGTREHPRVREAVQYLLDRAIPGGGWNIGNPFMVTGSLPPTVENTALTLLALDALKIESEVQQRGQAWLARRDFTETAFEWAWRAWYWKQRALETRDAAQALAKLQRADGSWDGNPFVTAIAVLGGMGS
jgi:squalene cyclase